MEEKKKCPKCELIPEFPKKPVTIYVHTEIDFLMFKLSEVLSRSGIQFKIDGSMMTILNRDFCQFLGLIQEAKFSSAELEEMKISYLEQGERILSIVTRLRPLSFYLLKMAYEEYFEILRNNFLKIYFHPIVNFSKKAVIGFECLIRGITKSGEIVYPDYLFMVARQTDTLFYLDRSCRETAIKTAANKNLKGFKIFINFLPTVIYDPNFCLRNTVELARQMEFDFQNIVFEVVESEKVQDLNHLKNILEFYRNNGFLVALDDVGTGYSSLDALIKLCPDFIKLSRGLVESLDQDSLKRDLVEAIVKSIRKNGIRVIAEGVETSREAWILSELGVELMQGYFFAKPRPDPVFEIDYSSW